jgi:hypothetical protein
MSFESDLQARMERMLRSRRAVGDGPIVVVTLELEHFVRWCDQADRGALRGGAPYDA